MGAVVGGGNDEPGFIRAVINLALCCYWKL